MGSHEVPQGPQSLMFSCICKNYRSTENFGQILDSNKTMAQILVDREFLHIQENIEMCIRWGPKGISWDAIRSETQLTLHGLSRAPVRPGCGKKRCWAKRRKPWFSRFVYFRVCLQQNITTKMTTGTVGSFLGSGKTHKFKLLFTIQIDFSVNDPSFDFPM